MSGENKIDLDVWIFTCKQQKYRPYLLCIHSNVYWKHNLISYLSERRTAIPLLTYKKFNYTKIDLIDNNQLSDTLQSVVGLPNISKESANFANEISNDIELDDVGKLSKDDLESNKSGERDYSC